MNILVLKYDQINNEYSYYLNESISANCKIFDYKQFSDIPKKGSFFIFIGCGWYGLDIGIANTVAEIASKYINTKFYFKLIFDEKEIENVIPKGILVKRLPVILYVRDSITTIISNGPSHRVQLEHNIQEILSEHIPPPLPVGLR